MQTPYAGCSLDELLADDLIQTMMDADNVNPAAVRSLFCALTRTAGIRECGGAGHSPGAVLRPWRHPKAWPRRNPHPSSRRGRYGLVG